MTTTAFYLAIYVLLSFAAIFMAAKWWEVRKYEKENQIKGSPSFQFGILLAVMFGYGMFSTLGNLNTSHMKERGIVSRHYEKSSDNVEEFSIPGVGKVKYMQLFSEVSEAGESMDSFALRVAPMLRQYSDENGYEACGVIASNGQNFSIIVGTNFANMVCVNSSRFVLEGYQHAGATLHSHGRQGRFRPTKTDLMLMESTFAGQRANLAMVHGQALNAFSNEDIKSGPGYLAGENGKLFYQGNGTSREVK